MSPSSFALNLASDLGDRTTPNLLLLCLSPDSEQSANSQIAQQIIALADKQTNWSALIELAQTHRVMPLLYHRLSTVCPTKVPDNILAGLRGDCQQIAIRNLAMTAELHRLLKLMETQGVETLPYKGPVLTQSLYQRLDLRQFGDLDIIIRPEDMPSVERLLIDEGYWPYFGKQTAAELSAYMKAKTEHTYDFYHKNKKIFLEVHWRFWPPFFSSVNPRQIWARRASTTLAGTKISTFLMEDYLIVLCMHGSRHMWERLAWLCDIALLVERFPHLDWQQSLKTAEQWGAKRMLLLGLYLAQEWLAADLPAEVVAQISADSAIAQLAAAVKTQMFSSAETPTRFMAATRYQVKVRERWQDKAVYASSFGYWLLKGRFLKERTADTAGLSAVNADTVAESL